MAGVPASECVNDASDRFKMTGIHVLCFSIQMSSLPHAGTVRVCVCIVYVYMRHRKFRQTIWLR